MEGFVVAPREGSPGGVPEGGSGGGAPEGGSEERVPEGGSGGRVPEGGSVMGRVTSWAVDLVAGGKDEPGKGFDGWGGRPQPGSGVGFGGVRVGPDVLSTPDALVQGAVDWRHPLALAHFANHPPKGTKPNVMIAAIDVRIPGIGEIAEILGPGDSAPDHLAYVPNVLCLPVEGSEEGSEDSEGSRRGPGGVWEGSWARYVARVLLRGGTMPTLALVATEEIRDSEVLLNYRLSPHVAPPPWYSPVDAAEDKRRWA